MQVPSILQGEWLTHLLQGAAFGTIATMIIGFNWGRSWLRQHPPTKWRKKSHVWRS